MIIVSQSMLTAENQGNYSVPNFSMVINVCSNFNLNTRFISKINSKQILQNIHSWSKRNTEGYYMRVYGVSNELCNTLNNHLTYHR